MPNESQDQQSMKEDAMNIELEPRPASRAGTTTEAHSETAELGRPQADIDGYNDKNGIKPSQDPGSAAQSAQTSSNESCVAGRQRQATEGDTGSQSHTTQEIIDADAHLSDLTDEILLPKIRDLLMSRLRRASLDRARLVADDGTIRGLESRWVRDAYDDDSSDIPEPIGWGISRIGDGWPQSRAVAGVVQYTTERISRTERIGYMTETRTHWLSRCWSPIQDPNTPYDTIEREWRDWCCATRNKAQPEVSDTVDNSYWNLRQRPRGKIVFEEPFRFSSREKDDLDVGKSTSFLSTTFQGGYSEKRVVVSFRVLREAPELFSILVLKDEDMSPDTHDPDQQFDFKGFWKGYGGIHPGDITPLAYYLLELEDLDNLRRVEELMFDNSFKRSKDYFVALQILRIIDEWLDEVQSTVEDMSKDQVLLKTSLWEDYFITEPFEVAVRYVNEHATATKSRVQKKREEINSLRDGLFNATSLRESTKAMALNQAIYVFTVVTVLFTPVSFLATFWALPFLNNPTEGSDTIPEPSAFRNSFIIMPILTYALVIGVAWVVGKRNSVRELLDLLREYWEKSRSLMRSAWSSRPELPW
ncbi:hypothetical protein F25303_8372 [Fusarium sp. NRRL 25303]|nr:hypothetical protein F25303_8372 [Fusarium sp. NRRL 25303]